MTDAPSPPNSVELEQAVLGAVLVNNDVLHLVPFLKPKHFYEPIHGEVFKALSLLIGMGRKATPATVLRALGTLKLPDGFNLQGYVARLAASATTVVNAPDFARSVLELSLERDLLSLGQKITDTLQLGLDKPPVTRHIEEIEAALAAVRRSAQERTGGGSIVLSEGVQSLIERADQVKAGNLVVPSTGLTDVDKALSGGAWPGRLVVVGGRPGMGKTVLLSEMLRKMANRGTLTKREEERFGTIFVTLEVDQMELSARLLAGQIARSDRPVAYKDIMTGKLDDGDYVRVRNSMSLVEGLPIVIEYAPGATMAEIVGRVRAGKAKLARRGFRLGAVAIDYLGLVRASERYAGSKVNELGETVLEAKRMAEDEETCVFLGAQLSRKVEDREDKRPDLNDLRDSGNIEEHADAVMLLYREAYYLSRSRKTEDQERSVAVGKNLDIIVAKNRLGATSTVHAHCDVSCSSVYDRGYG